MNLKRALWTGALSWVLVFFEVSVLMFGFGMQNTETSIAHYVLFAFAIAIPAWLYFKRAQTGAQEGFLLGVVFLIVSFVLDAVITVPLFVKDYSFFLNPYLLIGLVESFGITVCIGAYLKRR